MDSHWHRPDMKKKDRPLYAQIMKEQVFGEEYVRHQKVIEIKTFGWELGGDLALGGNH